MADVSAEGRATVLARPRVLLTGFGPFPGVAENPSGWLAETAGSGAQADLCTLYRAVLPTEWNAVASRAAYFHRAIRPRLMIHFGVRPGATEILLECRAHNQIERRADARGAHPECRQVLPECGDTLETCLPVDAFAARLRSERIPASVSQSCGRYLCNDLYFRSLHWAEQNGADALFVHVPQTHILSKEFMLLAADSILREAIGAVQLQSKLCPEEPGPTPPAETSS